MRTPSLVIVAMTAVLTALGGGTAHAEPVAMASKTFDKLSRDGWQLNIRLDREMVPMRAEAT